MQRSPATFLQVVLLGALSVGGCREDGDVQISSLSFTGVEQVDAGALEDALVTREGSWLPWGRQRYFDREAFEADLARIQAFYRDRGFPDARVRAFDVELNDAQDEVDITLHIVEGEPIRVSAVELRDIDVLPEDRREQLRDALPLQPEQPLARQAVAASRERLLNALRNEGYAYAEVAVREEEVAPGQRLVVFDADPGVLAAFGEITINGETSVDEEVIRRLIAFEPGDRFTRTALRDAQRKLYGLELFEFVNVEAVVDESAMTREVPVRVTVTEGDHQRVSAGVGYGTEEQARARLQWEHRNFLGGARRVGAEGKWSSLDRGVRTQFREPYFFTPGLSLNFEGQAWQAAEPVYSTNQLGGRMAIRREWDQLNFWSVSLLSEYQRSSISNEALRDFTIRDELIALGLDPRGGATSGTLSAVAFDASRNTTDSLLNARSGYVLEGRVEQAGRWLWGTFNYWSAQAEGRHYTRLGDVAVLANRLRVGSITPADGVEANVPFYKRFFLGGASSIRGWGRFEVSPLSGFGFPIGGMSMLEGSSELRFPLWGDFGGVVFLDYGNVWADSWDLKLGDLRYAAGPGLRYITPIGPLRFDVGYQLNPIEGLLVEGEPQARRFRMHFSVGQAF